MNGIYIVGYIWLFTAIALFQQFAPAEAAVRAAILAVIYTLAYLAIAGVIRLVRRLLKIGR